ncbi:MAG: outer membrane protein assembly factor BamD [Polyangiales bacterium]
MSLRKPIFALVACALTSASVACTEPPKAATPGALQYTETARRGYEEAMVPFKDRDWLLASGLMREVKRRFSFSDYAPLAQLRMGDIEYAQEKWLEATVAYKTFVRENPKHHEVAYARMRMARCSYNQISDAFLLPSQAERDQASVVQAAGEIKAYLDEFADGPERPQMKELAADVLARLVAHELYVARFYVGRDKFEAALARVDYALAKYVGSRNYVEALITRGEILLLLKRRDDAKATFERVVKEFAADPRVGQAQRYLDNLKRVGS